MSEVLINVSGGTMSARHMANRPPGRLATLFYFMKILFWGSIFSAQLYRRTLFVRETPYKCTVFNFLLRKMFGNAQKPNMDEPMMHLQNSQRTFSLSLGTSVMKYMKKDYLRNLGQFQSREGFRSRFPYKTLIVWSRCTQ